MFRDTLRKLRRPLFAALLAGATALPAGAETLADAMVDAYRHSALLDQNRAVLRAADEDAAAAIAALRPVLQWVAQYTYQNVEGFDGNSSSIGLQASMTLYDWGRNAIAIDIAKESVLGTRAALVGVEQDVLLGAVQAYLNVRSASEQVELQGNSVRVIGQEQQAATDRFEVGEITQTDVSQADAALAAARADLASAEGDLQIARENYRAATGKMPGKLAALPPSPKLPGTLDTARDIGRRSHPLIRQAQRQAAAAELGVAAAAAERNPELTGTASLVQQHGKSRNIIGNPTTSTTDTGSLSLNLSQTIYSGGRLPAAHRKAMAQRDSARAGLLNVSRQVDQAVGTAWAGIDVAKAQIRAIDEQIGPVFAPLMRHVIVFLRAADAGGGHAHAGGEIGGAKAHRLQARAAGGDFLDMGDAGGGFDDDLKADALLPALGGLDGGDQRIDGIDIVGIADLGDHDLVQPLAGLFQQVHHVAIPIGRVEAVDPHRQRLVAPVDVADRLNDVLARLRLVIGRHRILEVQVDHIGSRGGHLLEQRLARAGAEKLAAVQAGGGAGLQAEGHGLPFG